MTWLWVALGGAAGSALRYGTDRLVVGVGGPSWPFGTFTVNVLGSLLLGLLFVAGEGRTMLGVDLRVVLGTGAMGGFTTYSTFNLETLRMLSAGQYGKALGYVGLTLGLCLAAGALGIYLGRALRGS